jgi:hypothetical protein
MEVAPVDSKYVCLAFDIIKKSICIPGPTHLRIINKKFGVVKVRAKWNSDKVRKLCGTEEQWPTAEKLCVNNNKSQK